MSYKGRIDILNIFLINFNAKKFLLKQVTDICLIIFILDFNTSFSLWSYSQFPVFKEKERKGGRQISSRLENVSLSPSNQKKSIKQKNISNSILRTFFTIFLVRFWNKNVSLYPPVIPQPVFILNFNIKYWLVMNQENLQEIHSDLKYSRIQ